MDAGCEAGLGYGDGRSDFKRVRLVRLETRVVGLLLFEPKSSWTGGDAAGGRGKEVVVAVMDWQRL